MPPPEKPQPSIADRDLAVAWIDRKLDGPNGDTPTDPGWVTIHRLTRSKFNRTIHDLLGLDGDFASTFPADSAGGSGSFDNQSDVPLSQQERRIVRDIQKSEVRQHC